MPVVISRAPSASSTPALKRRRRPLDDQARGLAPVLAKLQSEGIEGVEATVAALNAQGMTRPNGKPFTFGATHRLKWRVYKLGLGPRPRTVSKALSARPYTPRASLDSRRESMRRTDAALARLLRAKPELMKELKTPASKPPQ
jgi:hypothetical protein